MTPKHDAEMEDEPGAPTVNEVYPSYGGFAPKGEPKDLSLHAGDAGPKGTKGMLDRFGRGLEATKHDQTRRETVTDPFMQSDEAIIRDTTKPGKQRPG